MKKRLGATYSMAPLIDFSFNSKLDAHRAYLEIMMRLDKNVYLDEVEREQKAYEMARECGS